MIHFFDTEIAEAYGVNCAVIFNHIYYWCLKNEANGRNCFNGKYWTYNSVTALDKLFPYLSRKQIRTALDKLRDAGMTEEGVFNEDPRDRTKWYTISEKGMLHFPDKANVLAHEGKCYSNNTSTYNSTTDNKPNNNTYSDSAENASSHDDKDGLGMADLLVDSFEMSDALAKKVAEWLDYKKEKKQTYKPKGLKTLLNKVNAMSKTYGDDPVCEAIDRSMVNNWAGIFFEDIQKNYRPVEHSVKKKKEGDWE